MEPSIALRARLRKLLNEVIPVGGTEADTKFLDAELDMLLTEADSLQGAASSGWLEKAGLLQGDIESYSAGTEKYDLTSLKDRLNHALAMAKQYAELDGSESSKDISGLMIRVCPPRVL
ncbi:hypothetical protein J41TS12_10680 [Paenibacillus antibioticophila]|uniref:Uncharacterized protein n=1 Tax=Paenibacillus antibioticophila TaxID=1274374 RepID=A0A920CGY9_9BACL|nr:hypothetical protein [Paenibacillus antibioticophila]GIO36207.1 hypothetical protein J41TS12_10680 [Paenibacillus antibioticophila]